MGWTVCVRELASVPSLGDGGSPPRQASLAIIHCALPCLPLAPWKVTRTVVVASVSTILYTNGRKGRQQQAAAGASIACVGREGPCTRIVQEG